MWNCTIWICVCILQWEAGRKNWCFSVSLSFLSNLRWGKPGAQTSLLFCSSAEEIEFRAERYWRKKKASTIMLFCLFISCYLWLAWSLMHRENSCIHCEKRCGWALDLKMRLNTTAAHSSLWGCSHHVAELGQHHGAEACVPFVGQCLGRQSRATRQKEIEP